MENRPLIGFLPNFHSIGETIPVLKIAQTYLNIGGKIICYSHGGKYEYLAKEQGFKIIKLYNFWKDFYEPGKKI